MKATIIAVLILSIVLISVFLNSFFISHGIEEIISKLEETPSTLESYDLYEEIFEEYTKKQRFIGLTVSHDDLTNIESEFHEILGSIEAKDEETLIIAKSRLIGALSHLRRLSGINADSIF